MAGGCGRRRMGGTRSKGWLCAGLALQNNDPKTINCEDRKHNVVDAIIFVFKLQICVRIISNNKGFYFW